MTASEEASVPEGIREGTFEDIEGPMSLETKADET